MKTPLILLLTIFTLTIFGQSEAYYQLKAGLSMNSVKMKSNESYEINNLPTFHAGISFRFPFAEKFYVQSDFLFIKKGYKATNNEDLYEIISKPVFVQLPLVVGINLLSQPDFKFFIHAGPEISIGVGGHVEEKTNFMTTTHRIKFGYTPEENDFDPYDIGMIYGIGFQYKKISFETYYDFGFIELAPGDTDNFKIYTRAINFSLGFIMPE